MAAILAAVVLVATLYALAPWVGVWWRTSVSRPVERKAIIAVLSGALILHATLFLLAPCVVAWGSLQLIDRPGGRGGVGGARSAWS